MYGECMVKVWGLNSKLFLFSGIARVAATCKMQGVGEAHTLDQISPKEAQERFPTGKTGNLGVWGISLGD